MYINYLLTHVIQKKNKMIHLLFCLIGFDFTILNDAFDYYVIGFRDFNPCNDCFKAGIVPMENVSNSTNSLVKLLSIGSRYLTSLR